MDKFTTHPIKNIIFGPRIVRGPAGGDYMPKLGPLFTDSHMFRRASAAMRAVQLMGMVDIVVKQPGAGGCEASASVGYRVVEWNAWHENEFSHKKI